MKETIAAMRRKCDVCGEVTEEPPCFGCGKDLCKYDRLGVAFLMPAHRPVRNVDITLSEAMSFITNRSYPSWLTLCAECCQFPLTKLVEKSGKL